MSDLYLIFLFGKIKAIFIVKFLFCCLIGSRRITLEVVKDSRKRFISEKIKPSFIHWRHLSVLSKQF